MRRQVPDAFPSDDRAGEAGTPAEVKAVEAGPVSQATPPQPVSPSQEVRAATPAPSEPLPPAPRRIARSLAWVAIGVVVRDGHVPRNATVVIARNAGTRTDGGGRDAGGRRACAAAHHRAACPGRSDRTGATADGRTPARSSRHPHQPATCSVTLPRRRYPGHGAALPDVLDER